MLTLSLAWSRELIISQTLRMVNLRYLALQKRNQENGTVAMVSVGQTNDTPTDVQVLRSCCFRSNSRLEDCKAWIMACGRPHDQLNPSVITKNYYLCSKVCIMSSALVCDV